MRASNQRLPVVCCFGSLQFKWSTETDDLRVHWRTQKTRELFCLLLHHHRKALRHDVIIDLLWPHTDWDKGISLVYSTIYQIRKMIKSIQFPIEIISTENQYRLLLNETIVDVQQWDERVKTLPPICENVLPAYEDLIQLYSGDYLRDYTWAEMKKIRLRSTWLQLVEQVAEFYLSNNQLAEVTKLYDQVQRLDSTNHLL